MWVALRNAAKPEHFDHDRSFVSFKLQQWPITIGTYVMTSLPTSLVAVATALG